MLPDEYRVTPIPRSHLDLLVDKRAFAHLATLMPDGTPQVTPVWIDFDGTHVLVNTAKGRIKDKNMRVRGQVGLSIQDPENPYRHVSIQGRVTSFSEHGAEQHIDKMAMKYLGKSTYPLRKADEVRVLFKIEPLRVNTMG